MARIEVISDVAGKVWRIDAAVGTAVQADESIITLESMKMEVPVESPAAGTVVELLVGEGDAVEEDQPIAVIEG